MSWFLQNDPHLVLLSFLYVTAVILVTEALRRLWGPPPDVSRKTVHILVAVWALPTALWFESALWAALMPAVFVFLNAISYRLRLMELIEEEGRGSPGTIYFPLSFAVLILFFWGWEGGRAASVAGLYAMGFGDAFASLVGRRYGRHVYRVPSGIKTWEGSLTMFAFSFAAVLLGTRPLLGEFEGGAARGAAGAATVAEAPAGRGVDNLTVPLIGALVFFLIRSLGG